MTSHNRSTRKFVVQVDACGHMVFGLKGVNGVALGNRLCGRFDCNDVCLLRNLTTGERLEVIRYADACDLDAARAMIAL